MSEKRIARDLANSNLDKRIEIFILRNQGWTFSKLAKKFGGTRQGIFDLYRKIRNSTIEKLEKLRDVQSKLRLDN